MTLNFNTNQIIFDFSTIEDKYNYYIYCKDNNMNEEIKFFDKYFDSLHKCKKIEWINIIIKDILPECLIHKYKDCIDWYMLPIYQTITEDFIMEHQDYIDWGTLITHKKLSESFIKENIHRMNWKYLSMSESITENIILENQDKVIWDNLQLKDPSETLLNICKDKINWNNVTFTDLNNYNVYGEYIDWDNLAIRERLTEEFIIINKDKLNWKFISVYQQLSNEFIETYKDKICLTMRNNLRPYNNILQSPINVLTYKNKIYKNENRSVTFDF